MNISPYEQGTEEWKKDRLGVFSASNFGKVLSPTTLKESNDKYWKKLAVEKITGESAFIFKGNYHTERGNELEPIAREAYEFISGICFEETGFIFADDDKNYGASPDGVNFELKIGLELKCYNALKCLEIMEEDILPFDDRPQVYGNLFVTDFEEWHYSVYHPKLKPFYKITKKTDEDYINWVDEFKPVLKKKIKDRDDFVEKYLLKTSDPLTSQSNQTINHETLIIDI